MDELVDLTRELVATPSHEDATPAGDLIEAWLREETAAAVRRDEVGNVIAARSAAPLEEEGAEATPLDGDGQSLALVGHHDVVPPDDEQVDEAGDYVAERRDGRLYGRGSADMKGAVAASMLAFRDAELDDESEDATEENDETEDASNGTSTAGGGTADRLVFASFVGEEIGGVGARHAIDAGFAPDVAVVGEGSTGYSAAGVTDVAVAHKGRRASTFVAHGESAHASVAEEGSNAIYRATDIVEDLEAATAPAVDVAGETVRGSVVVTEIEGGTAWNVVPDRCELTVDERTVPGERAALEPIASRDGVEWIVDQDLPPMRCGDDAFADLVLDAARTSHDSGERPEHVVKPHATDAGWLADAGTDCVICGPAEPGEAHTATESVSVGVLDRCRSIYRRTAAAYLSA